MESREEIQSNEFFYILKSLHESLYKEAADNQYTIVVPQRSSIGAVQMNEDFCKMHILMSSPYFKSEYTNLMGQCVELKDRKMTTKTGFKEHRTVDVLFEELFYNENYDSFCVLCVSAPLAGRIAPPSHRRSNLRKHTPVGLRSESEWLEILRKPNYIGADETRWISRNLEEFAGDFNSQYVMVKGFTAQAGEHVTERLTSVLHSVNIDDNLRDEISIGLEVLIISKLHTKIFSNLMKQLTRKDEAFCRLCDGMKHLSTSDLDIPAEISCDTTLAIETIRSIDHKNNPVSKLYCIFESCQQVTKSVTTQGDSQLVLSADDMLMLFTYVLLQSSPQHIHTNMEYLSYFHTPKHSTANLDYAFATFQGAVQYISNDLSRQFGVRRVEERRRSTKLVRTSSRTHAVSRPMRHRNSSRHNRARQRSTSSEDWLRSRATSGTNLDPLEDLPHIRSRRAPIKFEQVSENPLTTPDFIPFTKTLSSKI